MLNKNILFIFALSFLLIVVPSAYAATNVSSCSTISSSGDYVVNQSITSTTTCLIIASSNVNLDCQGNLITYGSNGADGSIGINTILSVIPITNITIKNCRIQDINSGGTTGYGIVFTRASNSFITNNTIQTNGTSQNYALILTTASTNNLVENNTINALGTTTINYGIHIISESNNNILRGNVVTSRGSTTGIALSITSSANNNYAENNSFYTYATTATGSTNSYCVYIQQASKNNTLLNNYVYSQGAGTNDGILVNTNSDNSRIVGNNVIVNGTEGTNYGIVAQYSNNVLIENNTASAYGTTGNIGIYFATGEEYSIMNNNTASSEGTTTNNFAISIYGARYNNITNNLVFPNGYRRAMNGTTGNHGINLGLGVSTGNLISENTISTWGTTTAYGIQFQGAVSNIVLNNTISTNCTAASSACYGVYLTTGSINNIVSNNTINTYGTSSNHGIVLGGVAYNNITDNIISTDGTSTGNQGINIAAGTNYNIISNNSIRTNGTGSSYGISLTNALKNIVTNNTIQTNGTGTGNHGIYILTEAENNTISYNTISTWGTTNNIGIYVTGSNYNKLSNNSIIANGSTQTSGTSTTNYGIYFSTNCYSNEIENNTVYTGGGQNNYGLSAYTNSNYNIFRRNFVYSIGTGTGNHGIRIVEGRNNTFENNVLSTSGSATSYGVSINSEATGNLITSNNVTTSGGTDSHGLYLDTTAPAYPTNNIFKENNLISISGSDFVIGTASINNTKLVNQLINNYSLSGVGGILIVENDSYGKISFLQPVTGATQTGFSNRIFVTESFVHFDEFVSGINKSAEITLYNISTTSTELQILRNGVVCQTNVCTNLTSLQAGNVLFNVTMAGNYSISPASNIPIISLNSPINQFNTSSRNINFNFTSTDDSSGDLNCSIYLNSTLNQTNSTTINSTLTNFLVQNIAEGNHTWYIECFDSAGNRNVSETRNISIIFSNPSSIKNYPSNNQYLNNINSIILNYTLIDPDMKSMTVWLYGNGNILNTSQSITNGTTLTYNWQSLSIGTYNWSVITNNGEKNSTTEYFYFTILNLSISCEAGGPYKTNSLVLIQGNVTNGNTLLTYQTINASIYKEGTFNTSSILNSSSGGVFQNSYFNLSSGNYTLNNSFSYQGYNKSCGDDFIIYEDSTGVQATSASFIISKIISLHEILSTNITYNISLLLTNKGGSRADSIYITDSDSPDTPYSIQSLNASNYSSLSYLKTYNRNSTTYNQALSIATANATDSLLNNEILANSSQITITVPATTANTSLSLTKNAQYLQENSTTLTYNLSINIINSGGIDLSGIAIKDQDISLDSTINLNRTQTYSTSETKTITKTYLSQNYTFFKANATYNSITYESNQISIFVPSIQNNASLLLTKSASLYSSTNINITYNLSLSLTNSGSRNSTYTNITDSDSPDTPYSIGILQPSETIIRSYLKTFAKQSSITNYTLTISTSQGIDSLSGTHLESNSSEIWVVIPALDTNASLLINKLASIYSSTNINITYNVSLILTNFGGRNATLTNLTDSDSPEIIYEIGTLTAGQTILKSYLKTYNKSSTSSNQALSIATANATDSLNNNLINSASSPISILIPSLDTNASLLLTKSASSYSSNNTHIIYNISLLLTNKGGSNATNTYITDSDSPDTPYSIGTLTAGQTILKSYLKTYNKSSTSSNQALSIATANATDSLSGNTIESNSSEINISISKIDSSAALLLTKSLSFHNLTNETFIYNISLLLTNKGGYNATNTYITDSDSPDTPYSIGTLTAGQTILKSYLINFIRNSTSYFNSTSIATANATDSLLNNEILANSSQSNFTIPSKETGQQITLIKNLVYNNQSSSNVNYTVSLQVINSGGIDLFGIAVTDDDINLSEIINLNTTQSYSNSTYIIITKDQNNQEHIFSTARAVINAVIYSSNILSVLVPGYGGGPNDISIETVTSVAPSTNFNSTITIKNKNRDIGQDFIINYWLSNNDETTTYSTGTQTLYVGAGDLTNSTIISILSPSSTGTYKLRANVSGTGVISQATALSTILVSSSTGESSSTSTGATSSGGGSSSGITGKIVYDASMEELDEGKYQKLRDGDKLRFTIIQQISFEKTKSEGHSIELLDLQTDSSIFILYPEQITISLKIGEGRRFNLNNDSYYDFYLRLDKIEKDKAEIYIKSLNEPIEVAKESPPQDTSQNGEKETQEKEQPIKVSEIFKSITEKINTTLSSISNVLNLNKNYIFIGIFCISFLIIIFIIIRKTLKKSRTYKNRLKSIIHKEVYTENGNKIGRIKEVFLENNKISGWLIKLDRKVYKTTRNKIILLSHKHIKSIGKIMIIENKVIDHLNKKP